jgi:hypothetical protein
VTRNPFRPWRLELGSSCASDVFRYLLACFRLRGGRVFDGVRWIYKVVREIAEATGYCERQVRRVLKELVAKGWVVRAQHEKHGIAPGDGGFRRRYWYAPGPHCPVPLRGRSQCRSEADMAAGSSVAFTSTPFKSIPSKGSRPQSQQPAAAPQERRKAALGRLQALVAPLSQPGGTARALDSNDQQALWAKNPLNPAVRFAAAPGGHRVGAGKGFA